MATLAVYDDPPLDGPTNMARDEVLLRSAEIAAALRLYGWSPATISLGYFQRFEELARLPERLAALARVRRQTGGGAILHDDEITYCLILDESLPLGRSSPVAMYRLVHECWRGALANLGYETELAPEDWPLPTPRTGAFFCFEKPGNTDLLYRGQKLLGSAQRRTAGRILQHGSLLVSGRFSEHPGISLGGVAAHTIAQLKRDFVGRLANILSLDANLTDWSQSQLASASELRVKYASDEWLKMR